MRDATLTATCRLTWDGRVAFGSRQHFYHFLLGYLLPALHVVLTRGREERYVLDSCGPVMDPLMAEGMALAGVERWAIVAGVDDDRPSSTVMVPRWDVALLREHLVGADHDPHRVIVGMRRDLQVHPDLVATLEASDATARLLADIEALRSFLLDAVGTEPLAGIARGDQLILVRSEQPAFYARGGPAEITGYGTFRRSLLGIEEGAAWLAAHGVPVSVFEPGAHSLRDQVRAFRTSAGVIGIAGAELANIVWMAPGSQVVVLRPKVMDHPFVSEALARLLSLEYVTLEVEGTNPRFDPAPIAPFLMRRIA